MAEKNYFRIKMRRPRRAIERRAGLGGKPSLDGEAAAPQNIDCDLLHSALPVLEVVADHVAVLHTVDFHVDLCSGCCRTPPVSVANAPVIRWSLERLESSGRAYVYADVVGISIWH